MGTGCIQRFRPPNHQHIGINRRRNGLVTHRWRHWGESTHNFKDSWRLRAWVGECGSVERVRSPASCRLMGGDTGHRRSGHTEFGDSGDDAGQNAGSGSNREHHPIRVGKARRTYAKYLDVP
jgi:hypothetical protein